jgi:hypothetical protein
MTDTYTLVVSTRSGIGIIVVMFAKYIAQWSTTTMVIMICDTVWITAPENRHYDYECNGSTYGLKKVFGAKR